MKSMERELKQNLETEKEQLASFRKEIQRIKDEEAAKKAKKEYYDIHFETIHPEELGEREYQAYTLYINGALTVNRFNELRQETINLYADKSKPPEYESIGYFWAFLGNKMAELESFQERIQRLKEEELGKKEKNEKYNFHFESIENPDYLGPQEYELYTLYKKKKLSPEEFKKRQKERMNYYDTTYENSPMPPEFKTIRSFWAYIGNQMSEVVLEELLEEKREQSSQGNT